MFVIASCIQMTVFLIYAREMFGLKRNIVWFVLCWAVATAIDEYIINLPDKSNTIINAVVYLLCLEGIAFIMCKGSWMKKLFMVLIFDVFTVILEAIVINSISLFRGTDVDNVAENEAMSNSILILTQMLISVIMFFIIYIWRKQKEYSVSTSQWLGLLLVSLGCFISICIMTVEMANINEISIANEVSMGYLVVCIILAFINFISYYFYVNIAQKNKMKAQTELQMKQIFMYEQWYEEIKNVRDETSSFRHDMKNHFSCMMNICESKSDSDKKLLEIERYLNSIGHEYRGLLDSAESGSMAIDAVTGIKKSYAEARGINFNMYIHIPFGMKCDSMDMVIILGNLLDNAIEACEKIKDGKKIDLLIEYNKKNLVIKVENSYNGELYEEKKAGNRQGFPKTTKGDFTQHGIGMQNVKKIVEKYNGEMSWKADNNTFKVNIFLYQPEKNIKKDELLQNSNEFLQCRL